MRLVCPICVSVALLAMSTTATAADVDKLLATLQAVGPRGAGHEAAQQAWAELVKADADQLPAVLAGLDDAGPLAANWIRTAVDVIAARALNNGGTLPTAELERFVLDRSHAPKGRWLAFQWLARVDETAGDRLMPGMLDDPCLEFRRDAVARLEAKAAALLEAGRENEAKEAFRRAMTAARDADQIKSLSARLEKLGIEVDLPRHFGFILHWHVIGPFDNTDEQGFDTVYPPETEIDLTAAYPGKHGEVRWIAHTSDDDYGKIDFNEVLEEEKEVAAYAVTEFVSDEKRDVQIRITTYNAVKLWVNGELVDAHNVYHAGSQLDQYVSEATLKPGRNVLLVKVCQNAQTQSWARKWSFQLRVCDETGTAVLPQE